MAEIQKDKDKFSLKSTDVLKESDLHVDDDAFNSLKYQEEIELIIDSFSNRLENSLKKNKKKGKSS